MSDLTSIKLADPEVYEGLAKELKRQRDLFLESIEKWDKTI